MKEFKLEIVTPEKTVYDAGIVSVIVPACEGYLGVMANHSPLLAVLQSGAIQIRKADNKTEYLSVSGGFIEVSNNRTIILADAVEHIDEIDVERAKQSIRTSRERLKNAVEPEEYERVLEALKRAENRVRLASKFRSE